MDYSRIDDLSLTFMANRLKNQAAADELARRQVEYAARREQMKARIMASAEKITDEFPVVTLDEQEGNNPRRDRA